VTTFEPGASDVFTQGFEVRPLSTAFFASSAAASITDGFEVFVHDVIEAITTCPWSSSVSAPFRVILVFLDGRPGPPCGKCGSSFTWPCPFGVGASLAGKLPVSAGSTSSSSVA